jgi:hypothetical protein
VQRFSESVGTLAAALAKAQAEIANPEKSLTATIVSPFPREGSKTFRYAPLSSGLELVRKCLGKHEIATVQATAIDHQSGLISLTTTLVHASGEWVSSDWPVCSVGETAAPQRLGAALTYARRYALFTLVGIAGEDDLDAPDLLPANGPPAFQDVSPSAGNGAAGAYLQTPQRRARSKRPRPPTLSANAADELRRRLLAEIEQLEDAEVLASWAHNALPLKNQLSKADAQTIEDAFTARLNQLKNFGLTASKHQDANWLGSQADPAEPTVTVISKPVRERDREHLKFVASQPCLICGRTPSDPHHIKFAEQLAMGRKVSDRFSVPICRLHHRELHRRGNERTWWQKQGIDPLVIAANLWAKTHAATPTKGLAAEIERPANVNGSDSGAVVRLQIDETKPIVRPEGG